MPDLDRVLELVSNYNLASCRVDVECEWPAGVQEALNAADQLAAYLTRREVDLSGQFRAEQAEKHMGSQFDGLMARPLADLVAAVRLVAEAAIQTAQDPDVVSHAQLRELAAADPVTRDEEARVAIRTIVAKLDYLDALGVDVGAVLSAYLRDLSSSAAERGVDVDGL